MYRLYRDPLGENIFSKNDHSTIEIGKSGSITVRGSGFGDNTRIKLLMKRVEELEKELQKHNISYECVSNGYHSNTLVSFVFDLFTCFSVPCCSF